MEVVLKQNDAGDWIYRGEGAANLVLAYNGCSRDFVGKVLRIQKAPCKGSHRHVSDGENHENNHSALMTGECLLWKEFEDLVSNPTRVKQLYVDHVMSPLLGSEHVDAGIRVSVSKEFLESVEKNVRACRPSWRVDAAKVNTLCNSALLLSDHSVFPHGNFKGELCMTVEIKPKCGFLPFSRFVSEENAVKKSITRFRMHQLLKLHKKEVSEISEYDPLDMFSGSKDRVHRAIKALFHTPQNNFRVFMNGILVFGGLGSGVGSTDCVRSEAFEDILKCVIQADDGLRTDNFLHLLGEVLFTSRILDRLLKVQKLDVFDIEGAIHAYYDIISQPCVVCRSLSESLTSRRYKYFHSMCLDDSVKVVKDYLIAATAKDSSMMISVRPREFVDGESPYGVVFLESTNQTFDYKVSFIDLDMKPLKKMEHYYELDQQIVRYYTEMTEREHQADRGASIKANGTLY